MFDSVEQRDLRWPGRAFRAVSILACCLAIVTVAAAHKKPPVKRLNLNLANLQQLEQLPGIGPAMAKRIVEMREKGGAFRRVDDLLAIRGISEKRLKKMRPYLMVTPPSTAPKKNGGG